MMTIEIEGKIGTTAGTTLFIFGGMDEKQIGIGKRRSTEI